MGFRKAIYDVEEKGLDPSKPHTELGEDGRLKADVDLGQPAAAGEPGKVSEKKQKSGDFCTEKNVSQEVAAPKLKIEKPATPDYGENDEKKLLSKKDEVSNNKKELPNNKSQKGKAVNKKKTTKAKTYSSSKKSTKTKKTVAKKKKTSTKRDKK